MKYHLLQWITKPSTCNTLAWNQHRCRSTQLFIDRSYISTMHQIKYTILTSVKIQRCNNVRNLCPITLQQHPTHEASVSIWGCRHITQTSGAYRVSLVGAVSMCSTKRQLLASVPYEKKSRSVNDTTDRRSPRCQTDQVGKGMIKLVPSRRSEEVLPPN